MHDPYGHFFIDSVASPVQSSGCTSHLEFCEAGSHSSPLHGMLLPVICIRRLSFAELDFVALNFGRMTESTMAFNVWSVLGLIVECNGT